LLDFYFMSRVSSRTGDRTRFTYGPQHARRASFLAFLKAYRDVSRVTERRRFGSLPEVYRFFILTTSCARSEVLFSAPDFCAMFRGDAVRSYPTGVGCTSTSRP